MIRHSAPVLVIATVARAYASSKSRNGFLRPPVRKPTLVWARTTVWAVIPAQVVTSLETMPVTGTKQVSHVVSIVQNSQVELGICLERAASSKSDTTMLEMLPAYPLLTISFI